MQAYPRFISFFIYINVRLIPDTGSFNSGVPSHGLEPQHSGPKPDVLPLYEKGIDLPGPPVIMIFLWELLFFYYDTVLSIWSTLFRLEIKLP